MSNEPAPACQELACAVQTCLAKNNFQESKCQKEIFTIFQCCSRMYEKDPNLKSSACSKSSVVAKRMAEWEKK